MIVDKYPIHPPPGSTQRKTQRRQSRCQGVQSSYHLLVSPKITKLGKYPHWEWARTGTFRINNLLLAIMICAVFSLHKVIYLRIHSSDLGQWDYERNFISFVSLEFFILIMHYRGQRFLNRKKCMFDIIPDT